MGCFAMEYSSTYFQFLSHEFLFFHVGFENMVAKSVWFLIAMDFESLEVVRQYPILASSRVLLHHSSSSPFSALKSSCLCSLACGKQESQQPKWHLLYESGWDGGGEEMWGKGKDTFKTANEAPPLSNHHLVNTSILFPLERGGEVMWVLLFILLYLWLLRNKQPIYPTVTGKSRTFTAFRRAKPMKEASTPFGRQVLLGYMLT